MTLTGTGEPVPVSRFARTPCRLVPCARRGEAHPRRKKEALGALRSYLSESSVAAGPGARPHPHTGGLPDDVKPVDLNPARGEPLALLL